MSIRITSLVAVLALCSCGGESRPKLGHSRDAPTPGAPVPFEVIVQTSSWTNLDVSRAAITTPKEWVDFWVRCYRPGRGPSRPDVNFETDMVLVATMGPRDTGGYSIAFERIEHGDGVLVAHVVETSPGPDCVVSQSLTAPATAILVHQPGVDVDFVERKAVNDCR